MDISLICSADTVESTFEDIDEFSMNREQEKVCFGTISTVTGNFLGRPPHRTSFPVVLESSSRFIATNAPEAKGVISSQYGQMIQGLLDEETIQLFASCALDTSPPSRKTAPYSQNPCTLNIAIYGPYELYEDIGNYFQEYDEYLQDPHTCHLDVKYCNPHRICSTINNAPMVSETISQQLPIQLQDISERHHLLDALSEQNDLEETNQPALISSILHKHQKQALTFMIQREKGWNYQGKRQDVWEALDVNESRWFVNRVSETHQIEPPPPFFGGIVADPMGLGKTLNMISLVAHGLEQNINVHYEDLSDDDYNPLVQTTLIVMTQPLLDAWEDQINAHVVQCGLRYRRHHGKSKLGGLSDLDGVHIVLTTYHTVSADWRAGKSKGQSFIFSVRFKRIILDEAHVIRNMKSGLARSVCELDSIARWAVTGTPVQNHLTDLAALLKFIRAYPYDDPKRFDTDISQLWKSGQDEEAVKRLKSLSSSLILRRAKSTIDLPPRHDWKCPVNFTKAERALYEDIRQQTITKIDDALQQNESEFAATGIYINFLQQIESMRLMCNLGLHYPTRHEKADTHDTNDWTLKAQSTFNIQRGLTIIVCSQCSSSLDDTETLFDDAATDSPHFSRCLKYVCAECSRQLRNGGYRMICGHTPSCPFAPVSINDSAFDEPPSHLSSGLASQSTAFPSKIENLIRDLKILPSDTKCIVFSTWRLTLDLIQAALAQSNISSLRFDGSTRLAHRHSILSQFRTDPSVQVLLLTLSCGAVGLTLTEASRAYLMEPHWNPTIEEQALARIHRLGQKKEVTTVRFYIRDSFEERVMEVQEEKKNLAGVLLKGHDGGEGDDSLGALQRLRALL